jgi:alpha-glucosidase
LIESLPSVWDETIVLPISEIGERAALARRSGDR